MRVKGDVIATFDGGVEQVFLDFTVGSWMLENKEGFVEVARQIAERNFTPEEFRAFNRMSVCVHLSEEEAKAYVPCLFDESQWTGRAGVVFAEEIFEA